MYKKRRFKPMQKRIVSLGMAAVMLMAVPSQSMLFHAKAAQSAQDEDVQDQSVESESGYRLYADELTSASGAVKGDVTEVLPGYEIINVKLPDGSLVNPEEVNFPVTESGDYVFEVIYNSASNDANPAKTAEIQDTAIQSADAQSTEGQVSEQGAEEQSASDALSESAGDTESEELTLTVTLPEEEAETEETAEPILEETQSTESESQEITSRNSVAESLQSNSNISTRAGGFSSTGWASANKTWSASDFTTKYSYYSNGHMDYSGNPGSNTIVEVPLSPSYDSARGVQFTFGGQMGTVTNQAYWIQQGAAFSDITFDFTKDFALEGYMRIGDSFGCDGTTNPTNSDMQIDGGVTISFIPTNQIQASKINAALEKGGAYRLGAYGTLPNSIVCEFDTSTETYYNIGDSRNFHINEDDVQRTGDYYYLSDESAHAWYGLAGKNIYSEAVNNGVKNGTHIGISTTNSSGYVLTNIGSGRLAYTSDRVLLGSSNTGTIPYQIIYNSNSQTLTFTVKEAGSDQDYRSISYNLTTYFNRQPNRNLNLAFTYGAAYVNLSAFVQTGNNPYFTGNRTGQIDIWAKEMYAVPDLKAGNTQVRWLQTADQNNVAVSSTNDAYYSNNAYDYNNRALWPVAGDRVYTQVNFTPATAVMPSPSSVLPGKLELRVGDLKVVGKDGKEISGLSPPTVQSIYSKNNDVSTPIWKPFNSGYPINISGNNSVDVRVGLKLPDLDVNSDIEEYYITGTLYADFTVGDSKVTYKLPLMSENSERIAVSRNPMYTGFNGQNYYSNIRIVKSLDSIDQLKNITNGGSQTANGDTTSLHHGVGYKPMSSGQNYSMYQDSSGSGSTASNPVKVTVQSASMDNLTNVTKEDVVYDKPYSVDESKDTRYILEYLLDDTTYSSKNSNLTGNTNRGKSTGKRVMWTSDNVTVSNGYEFYARSNVTMSPDEFAGFTTTANRTQYYNKIAKAAGATIFKTSDYNFVNKVNSDYSNVTGTGIHTGVEEALRNPGSPVNVTLRFTESGVQVERTISLTIADPTPKVVSNVSGSNVTNETSEKIIFNKEDYTVSATFKLVNRDGSDITYSEGFWAETEPKIKVAIYKKNGPNATGSKTNFHRWANGTTVDEDGKDGSGNNNNKIQVPVDITDNKDGTFTVTYTLLNNSPNASDANWVQATWEKGAQWRIYAWTETNEATQDYSVLTDTTTDQILATAVDSKVPSVTTTMSMINKDDAGSLPTTMFSISQVQLTNKGDNNRVTDVRETTTISLTQVDGVTEPNEALHDYYYEVSVNETQYDRQNRPYTIMTQEVTGRSFWARYYRYNTLNGSYEDVTTDNLVLGNISYPSNGPDYPSSIRFGMWADKQETLANGLVTDKPFTGQANFKFTRRAIPE